MASFHLIYLLDAIEDTQWSHLHRFLHIGTRSQSGFKSIFCKDLDLSGTFLSCTAKDYSGGSPQKLLLRYDIIASILEVSSHKNPFGFVNLGEYLESQVADN